MGFLTPAQIKKITAKIEQRLERQKAALAATEQELEGWRQFNLFHNNPANIEAAKR